MTNISASTKQLLASAPMRTWTIDSLILCRQMMQWLDTTHVYCVMKGLQPDDELPTTDEMEQAVYEHMEIIDACIHDIVSSK